MSILQEVRRMIDDVADGVTIHPVDARALLARIDEAIIAEDAEVERLLELHLVRIVNALRDGVSVSSVVAMTGCPTWLVERIGRDSGLVKP